MSDILAFPTEGEGHIALMRARFAATHTPGQVAHALAIRASKEILDMARNHIPPELHAVADEAQRIVIKSVLIEYRDYFMKP